MGEDLKKPLERGTSNIQVRPTGLGGVDRQIESINESLADFNPCLVNLVMPSFYEHSRGILLYGPKGTGKTALLEQIKAAGWRQTFHIGSSAFGRNIGDAESKLRNVFQEAMRCQPSAILIDQVEFIAPRRTSLDSQSLASVLCECIDATKNAFILIVAATRHPNDVDDALRTPHRLATEIELHIPTAHDRAQILRAICGGPSPALSDTLIDMIAEKTHGYVGADLFALLQLISRKARQRQMSEFELRVSDERTPSDNAVEGPITQEPGTAIHIKDVDVLSALQETRPTAMREVFLETPKVRWSDIGGQHEIKRRLQKAVERPLKHPERMRRLNLTSKKGVLLYGPPGCSKTLTVKALATEAGLNFLAVKGAEILSMYVGESERALREIFRKARSARPSIIFFDEIDAIASKRGTSSQGGVNVLTTLLNEMDGIEELKSVLVIAATNKPEVIDPALMRPGRLDNILYIGPPDYEARKEILDIWFRKSVINPEVEVDVLAMKTDGYSGAEIVSICETAGDAALDAEEETGQAQDIRWEHFEYALKQVKRQITAAVVEAKKDYSRTPSPSADASRSSKIVIEKLTKNVTESHLREIFGGFGDIQSLDLPMNKAFMTNRGTAYILYHDPADAEAAIAHMHEAQLDGAMLNFNIAEEALAVQDTAADLRRIVALQGRRHPLGGIAVLGIWKGMTSIGLALCRAPGRHAVLDPFLPSLSQTPHRQDGHIRVWTALSVAVAVARATAAMAIAVAVIGTGV
ncbi:hypothetical protein CBS147346_10120 [Aspergillus niger]|nr:hypothetical protein CBS147346_10120 [Aspergillus niger]